MSLCRGQGCETNLFRQAAVVRTNDTNAKRGSAYFLQADGSYRRITASFTYPNLNLSRLLTVEGEQTNAQADFAPCGYRNPGGGPAAAPPAILSRRPGAATTADFNGDGIPDAALAAGQVLPVALQTVVLVALVRPDFTGVEPTAADAGGVVWQVLGADLNGDNRADIVASVAPVKQPYGARSLVVMMNLGNGQFGAPAVLNVGAAVTAYTVWDVTGDGKPDVVASAGDQVLIFAGDGQGGFAAPARLNLPGGGPSEGLLVFDADGDGKPDILAGLSTGPNVTVYLNAGGGRFMAPVTSVTGDTGGYTFTAGDFDGDGKMDVAAVGGGTRAVRILIGNGKGGFRLAGGYSMGGQPTGIFTADINADGYLDIVQATGDPQAFTADENRGTVVVLYGNGDGTFFGSPSLPLSTGSGYSVSLGLASADLNGDGREDVASVSSEAQLTVLLSKAGGQFEIRPPVGVGPPNTPYFTAGGFVLADLNGDKRPDLAISGNGGVYVSLGRADGTFGAPLRSPAGLDPQAMAVGDFNNDGKTDLAVVNGSYSSVGTDRFVSVLLGKGDGTFQAPLTVAGPRWPTRIVATDFNRDGRTDVALVACPNGQSCDPKQGSVWVFFAQAGGGLGAPVKLSDGARLFGLAAIDWNGDGVPDLVTGGVTERFRFPVSIYLSGGDGTFSAPESVETEFGPNAFVKADVTRDGVPDMVIGQCCGDLDLLYRAGDGQGKYGPVQVLTAGVDAQQLLTTHLQAPDRLDFVVLAPTPFGSMLNILLDASPRVPPLRVVSQATGQALIAPESLAAAYGKELPASADGLELMLKDSAGTTQMAFVQSAAPDAVLFVTPMGLAEGDAIVSLTVGGTELAAGKVRIARAAPGLLVVGDGVANGLLVRGAGDAETKTPLYRTQEDGSTAPEPIMFGPEDEPLALELYGTGFRSAGDDLKCRIGTVEAPVQSIGVLGDFPGIDIVRVSLPRSLAGAGTLSVILSALGNAGNPVRIVVK
ncbi:MAG: VCBS repeat-containing protein [Acidobacteria bacterium]|nr:VCBS repeat-containing protein [Acidobacteriota bacterium]